MVTVYRRLQTQRSRGGTLRVVAPAIVFVLLVSMLSTQGPSGIPSPSHTATYRTDTVDNSPKQSCGEKSYSVPDASQRLSMVESTCQLNATISFAQNSTNGGATSSDNISFSVGGVAEVDPTGNIVQYANLLGNSLATTFGIFNDGQAYLGINTTANITRASGDWAPNVLSNGGVNQTGAVTGSAQVQLEFQFQISPADASALKFDVDFSEWPWASPADHLGLVLCAIAEAGARFAWNRVSQNLTEEMGSGGSPFAGLQLGPSATTFGSSGGPSSVVVTSDAGLYTVGTPERGAYLLINFTGGSGGYTSLHYDPWVIFSALTSSPGSTPLLDLTAVLAIVVGSAAAVLLGVLALRSRRTAPEAGMSSLA
jgi:hypothetical protein